MPHAHACIHTLTLTTTINTITTTGVIDGSALDDLSLVANLTELIHVKSSNSEGEDASTLPQFFPTFLWVLRDFTLRLEDEHGKRINSRQYLENSLKPQPGFDESIASKNKVIPTPAPAPSPGRQTVVSCISLALS